MVKFEKGQKVRLTSHGLRAFMATGGSPRRARVVNWDGRVGTVSRITTLKQAVVKWHGNKSESDSLPSSILELAE